MTDALVGSDRIAFPSRGTSAAVVLLCGLVGNGFGQEPAADVPVRNAPKASWSVSTLPLKAEVKAWVELEVLQLRKLNVPRFSGFIPQTGGTRLLYRGFDGLTAINPEKDGKKVFWHFTEGGLQNLLGSPTRKTYLEGWKNQYQQAGPRGVLFENAITATLATDGSRVFFVDDLVLPPPQSAFQMGFNPAQNRFGPLTEAVNRNTLKNINLESGKLHWELGGKFDNSEFKETFFLGAPLVVDDKIYLLNEKAAEIRLVCLVPKDVYEKPVPPVVIWTTSLGKVAEPAAFDFNRRTRPATFAAADRLLVCVTNAGKVVAVDLGTGKLRWTFQYRGKPEPRPLSDAEEKRIAGWIAQLDDPEAGVRERAFAELEEQQEQAEPALNQLLESKPPRAVARRAAELLAQLAALYGPPAPGEGWRAADPVILDGKVVFTAPDGVGVYCLALKDGALLWQTKREDGLYLAGGRKDRILVVGTGGVRTLRLEDGKLAGREKTALPAGSGTRFGPFYLLPVVDGENDQRGELLVVDFRSGKVRSRFRLTEPVGNLQLAGEYLLCQTTTDICAYPLDGFGIALVAEPWPMEDQQELWNGLDAPTDGERERAHRLLKAAVPGLASLLKKELRPAPATDHKRLAQLLKELEDPIAETRTRADEELEKLKDLAEPGLKQILASKPTLDLATRVEELLKRLPAVLPEQRRTLWTLAALERWGSPEARALLRTLASGEPNCRITREATAALERMPALR